MSLDDFLEQAVRTPFVDGVQDCALMASDWAVVCGWPDPAKDYRGRYSTALGRERLLKREGGLVAVMSAGFEGAGCHATTEPLRGDVGVISQGGRIYAAICLGERWAVKAPDGLGACRPDDVRKAWKIECLSS